MEAIVQVSLPQDIYYKALHFLSLLDRLYGYNKIEESATKVTSGLLTESTWPSLQITPLVGIKQVMQ